MLDLARILAITLDLDDTLWPIWPTIERAELALHRWLCSHAPRTAAMFANAPALRAMREQVRASRPDLHNNLSGMRRESLRLALLQAGDDPNLASPAFDIFFAERQRVELFEDALPALKALAARYPLVAITNGNANLHNVGLGSFFMASFSAQEFGVGKPDPRIFEAAAQRLGVATSEVLHVGDDATLDALGAMNAGMQAAWLNRGDHPWPHGDMPHVTVGGLAELCILLGLPA